MIPLGDRQKQLLFDYCLGLTSKSETAEAELLISSNPPAAEVHAKLKASLAPLDSLESESCPDDLVERTILRLNNSARSSQLQLEQLLASEQTKTVKVGGDFWRSLGGMLATAAVILLIAGVFIPPLNLARQKSWQQRCQAQLGRVFSGIREYTSDHDGRMPAVARSAGQPWWKVGYKPQSDENQSNTRQLWLLAKGDYVKPDDFVCPGKSQGRAIQFDISQMQNYNDFPARRYVTYSFRIMCDKSRKIDKHGQEVLMADLNPLFERLPQTYSKPLKLQLNKDMLNFNSNSHCRRGQNVLFWDGSVSFKKKRNIGILQDDIFTLQNTDVYQGCEVPSCETDTFLAP